MQYIYFIFILLCGNCLNFLLLMMIFIFVAYNVYERILINFLYQCTKIQQFFQMFGNFLC